MAKDNRINDPSRRNFYGRTRGKTLKPRQRQDLSEILPTVRLEGVSPSENPDRKRLDPAMFGGAPVWLEIGFGGGEHLIGQALTHPDVTFIGCEPFVNGVAMLLSKLRKHAVDNVRVYPGDARDLLEVLPAHCLAKAFLLYPDPWPKSRHHRRRFVTPGHLLPLAAAMQAGAELRIATDIGDYVRQTLIEVPKAGFEWQATCAEDWRTAWPDWAPTRYEMKARREGRDSYYLTFIRG